MTTKKRTGKAARAYHASRVAAAVKAAATRRRNQAADKRRAALEAKAATS